MRLLNQKKMTKKVDFAKTKRNPSLYQVEKTVCRCGLEV